MEEQPVPTIRLHFVNSTLPRLQVQLTDEQERTFGSCQILRGETVNLQLEESAEQLTGLLSNPDFNFRRQIQFGSGTDEWENKQQCLFKDYEDVTFNLQILLPKAGRDAAEEKEEASDGEALQLARSHLRKLERTVMKRLEIEELRKTVKAKSKVRGERGRNKKKNLTMLIVKQPNPKPARHFINDSTLQSCSKVKITEESESVFDGAESLPALPRLLKYYSSGENSGRQERVPSRQEKEQTVREDRFEKIEELMKRGEIGKGSSFARLLEEGTKGELVRQREVLQLMKSLMPNSSELQDYRVSVKGVKVKTDSRLRKTVASPYSAVRLRLSRAVA